MRGLYDRRHRVERGAFVVEGPQAVEAALAAARVRELYLTEAADTAHAGMADLARRCGARVVRITEPVARAMSETQHPQGVIAVCDLVSVPWSDDLLGSLGERESSESSRNSHTSVVQPRRVIVVLDRISDPGNAGTIIRTADAAGASAVVFTRGSVDPHNGKCVRSTAGSLFHLPIVTDVESEQVIDDARRAGVTCLAADGHSDVLLGTPQSQLLLSGDVLWVFGSEAHGVSAEVAASVDARVAIPIAGGAESLNLAAAAAICLYAGLV